MSDKQIKKDTESRIHLLFEQLRSYYNFRRKLDILLENSSLEEKSVVSEKSESSNIINFSSNKYIQNVFCLIDKDWINKWKRQINYLDIIKTINKNNIKQKDYEKIKPILENNIKHILIAPSYISKTYINNKLDIYSNFDIILNKCLKLLYPPNLINNNEIMKTYPVKISKSQFVIKLNSDTFQIVFRESKFKSYFEILVIFKKVSKEKSNIIYEFENNNTNDFLKNNKFNIYSDPENEINKYDCIFIIYNKTLKFKMELMKKKQINAYNSSYNQMKEYMNDFAKPSKTNINKISIDFEKNKQIIVQKQNEINNINKIENKEKNIIHENKNKINNNIINIQNEKTKIKLNDEIKNANNIEVEKKINENNLLNKENNINNNTNIIANYNKGNIIKSKQQGEQKYNNDNKQENESNNINEKSNKINNTNSNDNAQKDLVNNQNQNYELNDGMTKMVLSTINNNSINNNDIKNDYIQDNLNNNNLNNLNCNQNIYIEQKQNNNINPNFFNNNNQIQNNINNMNLNINNGQNDENNQGSQGFTQIILNNNNIGNNNLNGEYIQVKKNINIPPNINKINDLNHNFNNMNINNTNNINNNNINNNINNNNGSISNHNNINNLNNNKLFNNNNNANFCNNVNFNNFNNNNNVCNNNNMNIIQNHLNRQQNINNGNFVNNNMMNNQINHINQINQMNQVNQMNQMNQVNQMNQINQMQFPLIVNSPANIANNNMNINNNFVFYNNQPILNNINNIYNLNNFISNFQMNNNFVQNPYIKLEYPHLIGLQNIGQTCYMNSTIQCLSNISELSDYLINNYNYYNINEHPLTIAYNNLLFKLFFNKDSNKYVNPKDFKDIIGDLNPLFQGFQAADSKDLLFFLIERLHSELNIKTQFVNFRKDFNLLELEAKDENKMLQNFFIEFNTTNNSIISKHFYGIIRSKMFCDSCNITKFSFQTFNMQIFLLKKLKEDKKSELGQYYDKLTLMDAFIYTEKEEILEGENMIYCNNCKKLTTGKNKQDFYMLPRILIIVLNRGKNNADFNDEFDIPEYLDFTNQNIIINQNSYMKYYLTSVIKHLGESSSNGHFIAYVRKGISDKFLCYNDAVVSEVTIQDALKAKISNKEEEKITPYILFYYCSEEK